MKIKIPQDLRMKFVNMEGFRMHREYYNVNVMGMDRPLQTLGEPMISVELDLHDEPNLLDCCITWQLAVEKHFSETSFETFKIDIGPYTGLWPRSISDEGIVTFNVDVADTKSGHWKDWFIEGDIEYAPK